MNFSFTRIATAGAAGGRFVMVSKTSTIKRSLQGLLAERGTLFAEVASAGPVHEGRCAKAPVSRKTCSGAARNYGMDWGFPATLLCGRRK
ncbi:hypothetical protein [Xylophilus sp. Leaf220]|uniref:hypothetical protein n=1 Tax=Xylophilus sp. Leaf220 TaxID=1735686 RepID=UPI0012E179D1|nr:hypothetical protein [Xylophilus sp. Leaf220]